VGYQLYTALLATYNQITTRLCMTIVQHIHLYLPKRQHTHINKVNIHYVQLNDNALALTEFLLNFLKFFLSLQLQRRYS